MSGKYHFHLLAASVSATCLLAYLYGKTGSEDCLLGMMCGIVVYTIQIFKSKKI